MRFLEVERVIFGVPGPLWVTLLRGLRFKCLETFLNVAKWKINLKNIITFCDTYTQPSGAAAAKM